MSDPILVIVAEDEPITLMHTEQLLQDAGFNVIVADNGTEALAAVDDAQNVPVGLITDVRLGEGIDGWEVARHAREKHPSLAVVYITADSAADWTAYGVPKSILVQKPFVGAQLITALANLLNDQAGAVPAG